MARKPLDSYDVVAKRVSGSAASGRKALDSYDDVVARVGSQRKNSISPQLASALGNAYNIRLSNFQKAEDRINNWITGDRREDISSDIDAYERALEALKRYGKDTKAASEWIAGVRDDNNRSVRQNLIDDIGEARDARKGTLWEFAKQTAASIGATSRGETEKAARHRGQLSLPSTDAARPRSSSVRPKRPSLRTGRSMARIWWPARFWNRRIRTRTRPSAALPRSATATAPEALPTAEGRRWKNSFRRHRPPLRSWAALSTPALPVVRPRAMSAIPGPVWPTASRGRIRASRTATSPPVKQRSPRLWRTP